VFSPANKDGEAGCAGFVRLPKRLPAGEDCAGAAEDAAPPPNRFSGVGLPALLPKSDMFKLWILGLLTFADEVGARNIVLTGAQDRIAERKSVEEINGQFENIQACSVKNHNLLAFNGEFALEAWRHFFRVSRLIAELEPMSIHTWNSPYGVTIDALFHIA
jgi:hypothetical protein